MLAELSEHLDTLPADVPSTKFVLKYLRELNNLFEEGFLCHDAIRSVDSPILEDADSL